ncbi:hypothetical protein VCRA2128O92_350003 [Vibrio crassostreae]|nr:hypothetical protein VCRA2128O101_350003 [Vibrio crassostreae]CAK3434828.1 hypothetical protein VCRA2125O80_340003 [Vibrio crassostreae]CAK3483035.1 hypothetical protein VCRA2126O87_350003 [Vibrio crassostreae]CAK3532496.1 hypothetical protein VCRA2128O109_350003 [Vibrio crassostreae]CAK3894432.1 hypothetical protein VCRA2128O97_350003 [Vibrio crassostreae]
MISINLILGVNDSFRVDIYGWLFSGWMTKEPKVELAQK